MATISTLTGTDQPARTEVDDLDPAAVRAGVGAAETAERRAGLAKLALRWCLLHPATADTGAAVWGDAGLPGLTECDDHLGGEQPRVELVETTAPVPQLTLVSTRPPRLRTLSRGARSTCLRPRRAFVPHARLLRHRGRRGDWPRPPTTSPRPPPRTSTTGWSTGSMAAGRC